MAHITVPEIAARMGVSAATAKRRIAEWMLGTGSAPMRPGRAYVLTEQEFSQVMEFTRCRSMLIAPGKRKGNRTWIFRGRVAGRLREITTEFGPGTPARVLRQAAEQAERELWAEYEAGRSPSIWRKHDVPPSGCAVPEPERPAGAEPSASAKNREARGAARRQDARQHQRAGRDQPRQPALFAHDAEQP